METYYAYQQTKKPLGASQRGKPDHRPSAPVFSLYEATALWL